MDWRLVLVFTNLYFMKFPSDSEKTQKFQGLSICNRYNSVGLRCVGEPPLHCCRHSHAHTLPLPFYLPFNSRNRQAWLESALGPVGGTASGGKGDKAVGFGTGVENVAKALAAAEATAL
jgi:hypothetical protein